MRGKLNDRPLAGVRVLDFGLLTAGANTSAMLADLGAEVLKIESGTYLDPFRVVGKPDDNDGWWNRSPQFRFTNRNKRGLALNLKDKRGQDVIRELAKSWSRISAAACSTARASAGAICASSTRVWYSPRSPARATPAPSA
jgi:crotonobetainyl-CoA:carnitine CoA-transferase CaiB-like acyl-CoA transferase